MHKGKIRMLEESHRVLHDKIDTLEKSGVYTDELMQHLKKQKLTVLDQLSALRKQQYEYEQEIPWDDER